MPVKGKKSHGKKKSKSSAKKSSKRSSSRRPTQLFDGYDMGMSMLGGPFSHTNPFDMMMFPQPFPHPLMMPNPSTLSIGISGSDSLKSSGLDKFLGSNNGAIVGMPGVNQTTISLDDAAKTANVTFGGKNKSKKSKKSKKPKKVGKKKTTKKKGGKKRKKTVHDNIY